MFFSIAMQRYSLFLKLQNVWRFFFEKSSFFFKWHLSVGALLLYEPVVEHVPSNRDAGADAFWRRTVVVKVSTDYEGGETPYDG